MAKYFQEIILFFVESIISIYLFSEIMTLKPTYCNKRNKKTVIIIIIVCVMEMLVQKLNMSDYMHYIILLCILIEIVSEYEMEKYLKVVIVTIFLLLLFFTENTLKLLMLKVTGDKIQDIYYSISHNLSNALSSRIILLILVKCIVTIFGKRDKVDSKKILFEMLMFFISLLGAALILAKKIYGKNGEEYLTFVILTVSCITISIMLIFYFVEQQYKHIRSEQELLLLNQSIKDQASYYKNMTIQQTIMNKTMHDLKHQFYEVCEIAKNPTEEGIMYIQNLYDRLISSIDVHYTNIESLDMLIWTKKKDMENKNIEFEYKIFLCTVGLIDKGDICVILGNLMENAIEECVKIKKDAKIVLVIKQHNDYLHIEVQNTILDKNKNYNIHMKTTKKIKTGHGIGLNSIAEITKKYKGFYDIRKENNQIISMVNLYMK